jgi:hypothetical protein
MVINNMSGAKIFPDPDPELNYRNNGFIDEEKRDSSRPYDCLARLFKSNFVGGCRNSAGRKRKEPFYRSWRELTYPGAGG